LAARRALTFLEQQPNVDPEKLGIYGFSMGGVITLRTAAIDKRVKAAAPAGAPPLTLEDTLQARTSSPMAYAPEITCPIIFATALNDFHGHVEDIEWIIDYMPSNTFAMCREPHFSHKGTSTYGAAIPLWFDAHLKKSFSYPDNPEICIRRNLNCTDPNVRSGSM
jgi:dienelactone hydrolase